MAKGSDDVGPREGLPKVAVDRGALLGLQATDLTGRADVEPLPHKTFT